MEKEVEKLLTDMACERDVSASTQNQPLVRHNPFRLVFRSADRGCPTLSEFSRRQGRKPKARSSSPPLACLVLNS